MQDWGRFPGQNRITTLATVLIEGDPLADEKNGYRQVWGIKKGSETCVRGGLGHRIAAAEEFKGSYNVFFSGGRCQPPFLIVIDVVKPTI
jgi:hypothetical protein